MRTSAKKLRHYSYRTLVWFMVLMTGLASCPSQIAQAQSVKSAKVKPFVLNHPKPRQKPSLKLIQPKYNFSSNPTDEEISRVCILPGPIVPIEGKKIVGENAAVTKALLLFTASKNPEDISALTAFLHQFPESRWRPAIELNLGLLRFQTGYLSQAMIYWNSSWSRAKTQTGPRQQAFASRAASELAMLNARLGRAADAQKYLNELKGRKYIGGSGSLIKSTEEGLALMRADPTNSFKCGPYAVNTVLYVKSGTAPCVDPKIEKYPSTVRGTSLAQINKLAQQVGLKYQIAKRSIGAPLVVPSIMHWNTEHFSAITTKERGKYRIQDPTFGPSASAWVSLAALDAESDGYFLIPEGPLLPGWHTVGSQEAENVWGKGVPVGRDPSKLCCEDQESGGSCQSCGMATASALTMNSTVHIVDTPLLYNPPIGPDMPMTLTYNAYEGNQPFNTFFSNVGYNWSFNWFSYVVADASQNLSVSVPGGGFEACTNNGGSDPYSPNIITKATMIPLSGGGYQRLLPDGATQNYTLALSQLGLSYYLMTSYADAQGNAATLAYDSYNRLSTVTDACGNVTSFTYLLNTPDSNNRYLLLSAITDAFGRSATVSYDSTYNYISSITDAVGNVSSFVTDHYPWPHITSMNTPYGTTNFTELGSSSDIVFGTKFTFPDSSTSVIQNTTFSNKDTYYWDREAMSHYPTDYIFSVYSHCQRTHFLWEPLTNYESPVPAWTQKPLETLTFYTYPSQPNFNEIGTINNPATVTRMLAANRVFDVDVLASSMQQNDQAILIFCDKGLPGNGQVNIAYTIQSSDTVNSVAAALTSLVNANTDLSGLGISARFSGNRIFLQSLSPNATSFFNRTITTSAHSYPTEFLHMDMNPNISQTATLSGDVTAGDIMTLTVFDAGLTGGQKAVNYTIQSGDDLAAIASGLATAVNADTDLQSIGVSASVVASTVTISSTSDNLTTYQSSTSSGSTENIALASDAQTWQYQYNSLGNVTQSIDPVGRTFSYSYDSNNIDLLEQRETKGTDNYLMSHWEYNDSSSPHQPTLYVDGSGQHTQYSYNSLKELETTTDALGNVTTRSYDSNGYLTQVDGPLAGSDDVTNLDFFGYGLLHTMTDSEGYQLTFSYDDLNRKLKTEYPDGTFEQIIYDRLDPVLKSDRLGRWTQRAFDAMDDLVAVIDPLGRTTKLVWCICGGIMAVTDPLGQTTSWSRDLEGRVVEKKYADGTATDYAYDNITGRLATKTDASGTITSFTYNTDDSLAQKSYANGYLATGPTSYTYDPAFARLSTADNSTDWGSVSNTYNAYVTDVTDPAITGGGMLASVTSFNNWVPNSTILYSYDELGRVSGRTVDSTSYSASWTYDAMSRLTSEVDELGTFNFRYVDDSSSNSKGTKRISSIEFPNGQKTNFTYYGNEKDQRLKQISNLRADSSTLSQFAYVNDPSGQIVQLTQIQKDKSVFNSVSHDELGQLLSVIGSNGTPGNDILSQNTYFYDNASNRSGAQKNCVTKGRISGTVSGGDVLNIVVTDAGLSSGPETVSYTVQSGDTINSIAAKLAAAITGNVNLQNIGVNAAANLNILSIQSVSRDVTTYHSSKSTGATESIRLGMSNNFSENIIIGGTKTTGDTIELSVHDSDLTGGHETVTYTVQSTDTLSSIASNLKVAINANTALQALGLTATSFDMTCSLTSTSLNATTYSTATNTGATEDVSLNTNPNGVHKIGVVGTVTAGDTISISVFDKSLTGGAQTVSYVVQSGDTRPAIAAGLSNAINANSNLQGSGVGASASASVVALFSKSSNLTSYRETTSPGATEVMLSPLPQNGVQTAAIGGSLTSGDIVTLSVTDDGLSAGTKNINYTVQSSDTISSVASSLAAAVAADTDLQSISVSATAVNNIVNLSSHSSYATTYTQSVSTGATETLFLSPNVGSTQFFCNNVNELTNIAPGGPISVQGSSNKAVTSTTVGAPTINLNAPSVSATTYSGGSTGSETISFGTTTNGLTVATFAGAVSSGDVVSLTISNSDLSSGSITKSYTAQSGDTLYTIAKTLAQLINLDGSLQEIGQTAKANADTTAHWSKRFSGSAVVQPGNNTLTVTATDAASNTKSNNYNIGASNGSSLNWIYDSVGNFSYGPNEGYTFDTENRYTQLDVFTPSTPKTFYQFDAFGRCVSITSWENDVEVNHKIYIWSGSKIIQEQDTDGNVTKNYYTCGEARSTSNYFYTKDHLGSIREMTDASGDVQAQYDYDPYGRSTKLQGALSCDFQFAGYFYDPTSGFNLTRNRAYSPNLGRWISRDPIAEAGGLNLSAYVFNSPLLMTDSLGLDPYNNCNGHGFGDKTREAPHGKAEDVPPGESYASWLAGKGFKCNPILDANNKYKTEISESDCPKDEKCPQNQRVVIYLYGHGKDPWGVVDAPGFAEHSVSFNTPYWDPWGEYIGCPGWTSFDRRTQQVGPWFFPQKPQDSVGLDLYIYCCRKPCKETGN